MSEQNPLPQAPPPPQQSFGEAPGGTETVGAAPEAPAGAETEAAPKKKNALPSILLTAAIVVVAGAVLVGGWLMRQDDASNAQVGSCFDASAFTTVMSDASDTKTVDCNDAAAKYRVVGIVQGKKSDEVDPNKDCAQWDTASAGIWFGEPGEPGKVLCVENVTK